MKRVQHLTAIPACTIVNEPSSMRCGRDALNLCTIIFYMSIKFCTHYIHKSTHSFTIAHYVYMQAKTYSIFLNRAQWVLAYIRRSIVAPLF